MVSVLPVSSSRLDLLCYLGGRYFVGLWPEVNRIITADAHRSFIFETITVFARGNAEGLHSVEDGNALELTHEHHVS